MIERVINYLLSHPGHAPYLLASVETLQKHWDGPIILNCWPKSKTVCELIATEFPSVAVVETEPSYYGRGDQLIHKIEVVKEWGGMLIDADTLIAGAVEPFFEMADDYELTTTQFCDWTTTNPIMKTRIKRLLDVDAMKTERQYINEVLNNPWPSPNVGVFAAQAGCDSIEEWHDWTTRSLKVFISDETVMQPLQVKRLNEIQVITGGVFNCSTMRFQPKDLDDSDVVIWHGHGNGFARPDKTPRGHAMWWSVFKQQLDKNVANVQSWVKCCGNKRVSRIVEQYETNTCDWDAYTPEHVFSSYTLTI